MRETSPDDPWSVATDEAQVERDLVALLQPLAQDLARSTDYFGWAALGTIPAPPAVLLWLVGFRWWSALALGGALWLGLAMLFFVVSEIYDGRLVARAKRSFDELYPEASPARSVALRVLDELESPGTAEKRLREALRPAVTRFTRRRGGPAAARGESVRDDGAREDAR